MTVIELQTSVADALNDVEALVQGGCKAFAEDTRTVYNEADQWVAGGKVALVVVTPDMSRNGDAADGIPAETQLLVQCSEKPAAARVQPGVMTALDAAEIAAWELNMLPVEGVGVLVAKEISSALLDERTISYAVRLEVQTTLGDPLDSRKEEAV